MKNNFTLGLLLRLTFLLVASGLFVASLIHAGLGATRLLTALLLLATVVTLWRHVDRTNREVARFIEAVRHHDFSQTFTRLGGSGFDALGQSLEAAMAGLREERARAGEESRMLAGLVEEAPSALLLVDEEERVTLANKAARKLFRQLPGTRIADFEGYGPDIVGLLSGEKGSRRLIGLRSEEAMQRAVASRSILDRGGRRVAAVAVQTISEELSEAELTAQANLVRVLTHEIMNSLTPVVSLAQSAATLIAEMDVSAPHVADAQLAIETLARRTGGILRFVDSYRAFAKPPEPRFRAFAVGPWLRELEILFAASPAGRHMQFEAMVDPVDLRLDGDADLLAQAIINIVKNGAEAAAQTAPAPLVRLSVTRLPGARVRLTIDDNGPGIVADVAGDVFLPFFTTKSSGTGVGLSLARQIIVAHKGSIDVQKSPLGGARFAIIL